METYSIQHCVENAKNNLFSDVYKFNSKSAIKYKLNPISTIFIH